MSDGAKQLDRGFDQGNFTLWSGNTFYHIQIDYDAPGTIAVPDRILLGLMDSLKRSESNPFL
jgi:hypothetical protein